MKIQIGTQFLDTDDFDDMQEAAEATEMILAAHQVVNQAIATGEYEPFVPAEEKQGFISRRAQKAMLLEQMSFLCDVMLLAREMFERGDCDDATLGVVAYIREIGSNMGTTIMKGWSTEQIDNNSAELDAMMVNAANGEPYTGMAKVGVDVLAPMIRKYRQSQATAALRAQLYEMAERGCGDPECEACPATNAADEPGDMFVPDEFTAADDEPIELIVDLTDGNNESGR